MGNRNDERECRNNNIEDFETSDSRISSCGEVNGCCRKEYDRFADVLAEAYNDGYNKGYVEGFKDGCKKGRVEGFQAGCKAGQEMKKDDVRAMKVICTLEVKKSR